MNLQELRTKLHAIVLLLWWLCLVFNLSLGLSSNLDNNGRRETSKLAYRFKRMHREVILGYCTPLSIEHGSVVTEGISKHLLRHGTRLQIKCDTGYQLMDPSAMYVECQKDGTWTGHDGSRSTGSLPPSCVGKHPLSEATLTSSITGTYAVDTACDYPLIIRNGIIDTGLKNATLRFPVGHRITYSCKPGYQLEGTSTYTCTSTRKWSPINYPSCKELPEVPSTAASTLAPTSPTKSLNSTIMQALLYVSIPLLLILAIAIACNIKNRAKRAGPAGRRQPQNTTTAPAVNDAQQPVGTATDPLLDDVPHEQPRPDSDWITADDECLPPSYEEVIKEDRPPSFYTVQRSTMSP